MPKRERMVLTVFWTLMSVMTATAQEPSGLPQPRPEHKKLGAFVGTWKDEAEMKPGPLGGGRRMSLTQTCEWFTGDFSIVCHTETLARMSNFKTFTVLTYDAEEQVYRIYEFNSAGWNTSAKGSVNGDTWTFVGQSKMGGKLAKSRSTIELPSPDAAAMRTEMSVNGGPWTLLMELKANRVKQSLTDFSSCVPHGSEGWPFELFECYRRVLSSN